MAERTHEHTEKGQPDCPVCGSGQEGCCVCQQMLRAEAAEAEVDLAKALWKVDMRDAIKQKARAQAAEAERDALRAQVEAVRALADDLVCEVRRLFHANNAPREAGRVEGIRQRLAALVSSVPVTAGEGHTPGWPCGGRIKCPACCDAGGEG